MSLKCLMRKTRFYLIFLIFLFIFSCSPTCNQWKLAVIKADCPPASYLKAYLPASNTFNGLEAVLMCCNGNIHLYLNTLTLLFPVNDPEEKTTDVFFKIDQENYHFIAERLDGGQSLRLSDNSMELIIQSLLEKKCVEITVGRYQTTLIYENFDKTYEILYQNVY